MLVEPLPYQDAARIVHLVSHNLEAGAETRGWVMSLPYFSRLRERAASLSAIGGYDSFSNITRQRLTTVVEGGEGSARLPGTRMSPALFEMLGVKATLGRHFDAGEEEPARNPVMLLSQRAWQTTFGGDRAVLGRSVWLDGRAYGGFAAVAVLLAATGIYAVVAHTVGRRTREIGTRMALGARRRDVIVMILRQSGTSATAGIAAGLAGAAALARSLDGRLFGVTRSTR